MTDARRARLANTLRPRRYSKMGALSLLVRRCVICGKLFRPTQWKQKTCDVGCRAVSQIRPKKGTHAGTCEWCGKPFVTRQDRKYCNNICRANGNDKKVFKEATCPECGKTFQKSTEKKVYCGSACYRAAKSKREKARREREQT